MKIMLVDDRPTKKPLRTKDQVESLAYCRLSYIVASDQKRVPSKIDTALRDAAKVRNLQSPDAHFIFTPRSFL
jgi:hypothetical protein